MATTSSDKNNMGGVILTAIAAVVGGWLLHDVTNGNAYVQKAEFLREQAVIEKQLTELRDATASNAAAVQKLIVALEAHLAVDDPRYRTRPLEVK